MRKNFIGAPRKKLNTVHAFVLLALAITGCSDSAPPPIQGSWHWVRAVGGATSRVQTPITEGFNQKVIFSADGLYWLYRNDTLIEKATYRVQFEENRSGCDGCWVVMLDQVALTEFAALPHFTVNESMIELEGDSLTLKPFCNDCPVTDYLKIFQI